MDPDLIRDSTDEDADRALTSVRIKLDKSLSIEYTVNDLIQQARDPANLGSIFVGCVKLVCLLLLGRRPADSEMLCFLLVYSWQAWY